MAETSQTSQHTHDEQDGHAHHHHDHDHDHAHHAHHHHHGHGAAADVNREHYNEIAERFDDIPQVKELCAKVGQELIKEATLDKEKTELLDFACGTGLITKELLPHVKSVLGVDISEGVVDVYNRRYTEQGLSSDVVHAITKEIKGDEGELDGRKFDLIICASAYHHLGDPVGMTRNLVSHLKQGGELIIADRIKNAATPAIPEGMPFKVPVEAVPHICGFTEPQLREMFEGAGLTKISFRHALTETFANVEMELFVAKGVKAA